MNEEDDEIAHFGNSIKASKHPIEPIFVIRHGQHQYQPEHEFDFISTPAPKLLRCSPQQHFGDVHRLVSRSVFAALKIKHLNDWL